ncbi:unnamed protein product, partial [Didymodactylos carnosus]
MIPYISFLARRKTKRQSSTSSVCQIHLNANWNQTGELLIESTTSIFTFNYPMLPCVGNGILSELCQPSDLFLDKNNDVYIVNTGHDTIEKLIIANKTTETIVDGSQGLNKPSSLFIDNKLDDMYILDYVDVAEQCYVCPPGRTEYVRYKYRVKYLPRNSSIVTVIIKGTDKVFSPTLAMYLDKDLNIYISNYESSKVKKWFAPNYTYTITVAAATDEDSMNPSGIVVDQNYNLYIIDILNDRIVKWLFQAATGLTIVSNISSESITLDCHGNIYFALLDGDGIYRFNISD